MSEPAARLATALERLRVAAVHRFAGRLGVRLGPDSARAVLARHGLVRVVELLRLTGRLPRPLRPLVARWLLRSPSTRIGTQP